MKFGRNELREALVPRAVDLILENIDPARIEGIPFYRLFSRAVFHSTQELNLMALRQENEDLAGSVKYLRDHVNAGARRYGDRPGTPH